MRSDWERRLEAHTDGIMRELDDSTERSLNAALAVLVIGLCLLAVAAGLKQLWLSITVFGLMTLGYALIVIAEPPGDGVAAAVRDRLYRAAEGAVHTLA
jgi:hypothetical protein